MLEMIEETELACGKQAGFYYAIFFCMSWLNISDFCDDFVGGMLKCDPHIQMCQNIAIIGWLALKNKWQNPELIENQQEL